MTPLDWLILASGWSVLVLIMLLLWFDVTQKLQAVLTQHPVSPSSSLLGAAEALPETFVLTEAEAARVETAQQEASMARSQLSGRSERNWSRAR